MATLRLDDFSGGLNLRDAPSELAPTESPDMLNVTLDERGGVVKRLGILKDGSMSAFAADGANLFYSNVLGQLVLQEGVNVRKRTGAGAFTLVKAFSTAARVTFADFNGKLLMLHPVDGLFNYTPGGTLAGPHGGANIKGNAIAVWQNKVWVASAGVRLYFSVPGDETDWAGTGSGSVDLREVDDAPLTALSIGRGALLAWKVTSFYRVNDSTTGAFTTIDSDTGCPGAIAVATLEGTAAVCNERGVFVTDGLTPLVEVSRKLSPLFSPQQLVLTALDKISAGVSPDGRFLFSFRRAGATVNDLTLEYDPRLGWIVPHGFGASAFAVLTGADDTLYHLDPGTVRLLYKTFSGGSDNGAAIACRFQTPWIKPAGGYRVRLQHLRVSGLGAFSLFLRTDYENSGGSYFPLNLSRTGSGFVWGSGVWGVGLWGSDVYDKSADVWPRKIARALSFRIEESSILSTTGPAPLGGGAAPEVGPVALYGLLGDLTQLERS